MKFFTSDIHFCNEATMKSDNRPFKNIKSFDRFIIKDFNKTAKSGDTIYAVGDLLNCSSENPEAWRKGLKLIKRIKADIILIMGNNEQRIVKRFFGGDFNKFVEACKQAGIKEVHHSLDVEFGGRKFHLVHQIKEGDKRKFNLFGHTHLCLGLYHPYGLCVSTDLNHFRLFTEEIILGYCDRKINYWEPDENCNFVNPFLKEVNGKIVNIKQKNNKAYQKYMESYK